MVAVSLKKKGGGGGGGGGRGWGGGCGGGGGGGGGGRPGGGCGGGAAGARLRLDFVHLATERYFLAASRRTLRSAAYQMMLQTLRSKEFASSVSRLPGYDPSRAGEHESVAAALSWIQRARLPASGR